MSPSSFTRHRALITYAILLTIPAAPVLQKLTHEMLPAGTLLLVYVGPGLMALMGVAMGYRLRYHRELRRFHGGLCPTCAYSLSGNESGVCPECGTGVGVPAAKSGL